MVTRRTVPCANSKIEKGTGLASSTDEYREYKYDNLHQLTEEKIGDSKTNNWEYDGLGNITRKITTQGSTKTGIKYNYGADSSCGWNNLLTSVQYLEYNGDVETVTKTETIDYDAIGNPLIYRGATLNWYGRQLTGYSKSGKTITMGYDADGLRSSKTVNGVKTTYQYVGDKLFYENRGNGDSFYYFYDSYGKLSAIYHHRNGTKVAYHVVTNAQGDVVSLYNYEGGFVASYEYDAWGNCTIVSDNSSTGIATLNPFRYRGYYFDSDLGLYYLQSRYYDAEIGRFINADGYITTGQGVMSYNMYSYCSNNPVMYSDDNGMCSRFLGVFWKVDCKNPNCSSSRMYKHRTPGTFEEYLEKMTQPRKSCCTVSVGLSAGSTTGGNTIGKSAVLSIDTSYNYALQETTTTGVSTGEGTSFGLTFTYTNAENVQDLSGSSEAIGGSIVALGGFAVEYITFVPASAPDKTCYGVSVTLSMGAEAEVHSVWNETSSTNSWNPLKKLKGYLYGG